jgi:septal ring factor EnvC (AmiA/AmiB activator)
LPDTEVAIILSRLDQFQDQLQGVEEDVDRVEGKVDQASRDHGKLQSRVAVAEQRLSDHLATHAQTEQRGEWTATQIIAVLTAAAALIVSFLFAVVR